MELLIGLLIVVGVIVAAVRVLWEAAFVIIVLVFFALLGGVESPMAWIFAGLCAVGGFLHQDHKRQQERRKARMIAEEQAKLSPQAVKQLPDTNPATWKTPKWLGGD